MSMIPKKILLTVFLTFILQTTVYAHETSSKALLWLNATAAFSANKILANISPHDGLPGAVIASPSRSAPDYYYHWVRDAGLVTMSLMRYYESIEDQPLKMKIEKVLFDYLDFSTYTQNNAAYTNLGEPKFYVNGAVYEKPWGRPQNDGPAMRALSLIHFANILLAQGKEQIVRDKIYHAALPATSPVKKDLEYISHHWKDASYDLWEEVKGTHFYTLMVIRRALLEGSVLAQRLHDEGAARWYQLQAREIEIELENFWDEHKGYFIATINRVEGVDYKVSNLDTSVLLGLLHGGMNDGFLAWDDPRVISTTKHLIEAFTKLYPINQRQDIPGIAIGRYPEDRYNGEHFDGGNPWPLCTLAVAEVLYEQANLMNARGDLDRAAKLTHHASHFVKRVKYHAHHDGTLDEQIDRYTGLMTSARDLSWNYAALLTTRRAAIAGTLNKMHGDKETPFTNWQKSPYKPDKFRLTTRSMH